MKCFYQIPPPRDQWTLQKRKWKIVKAKRMEKIKHREPRHRNWQQAQVCTSIYGRTGHEPPPLAQKIALINNKSQKYCFFFPKKVSHWVQLILTSRHQEAPGLIHSSRWSTLNKLKGISGGPLSHHIPSRYLFVCLFVLLQRSFSYIVEYMRVCFYVSPMCEFMCLFLHVFLALLLLFPNLFFFYSILFYLILFYFSLLLFFSVLFSF